MAEELTPPRWLEELVLKHGQSKLDKAIHGERLEPPEIESLFREIDFHVLSTVADYYARKVKNNRGSFVVNLYVSYTNICTTSCSFCAFYEPPTSPRSYVRSVGEIVGVTKAAYEKTGIREVHVVGGNNPDIPYNYYLDLISELRSISPSLILKMFTAEEIWFISKNFGTSTKAILEDFKEKGLNVLSGGGTEILDEEVQLKIAPKKLAPQEYLRIHEEAHKLGIKSNVIIMYGHIEEPINVARHLYRIRILEEKAPGFISLVLVRYNPGQTPLSKTTLYRDKQYRYGVYDLKITALSRLVLLSYIDNIVAYWVAMGKKLAQAALEHGANDLGGTFYNEAVISSARGSREYVDPEELSFMLKVARWEPYERDTYYNYFPVKKTTSLPWMK